MGQNRVEPVSGITFRILVALSISHCINDSLQSVITAVYPLFKDDLALTFAQIGGIRVSTAYRIIFRQTSVSVVVTYRDEFYADRFA